MWQKRRSVVVVADVKKALEKDCTDGSNIVNHADTIAIGFMVGRQKDILIEVCMAHRLEQTYSAIR